jgi:transposase-like protein
MRQGTGYMYGSGEDCISYKCEGCGRRVQVTPDQAKHFRGAVTACSRLCVMKAYSIRAQQRQLEQEMLATSESTSHP